ncbi:MAG: outer membrane lipoprotein-sorting protein [Fibrobacteria bacterium]|nr:outer membrane lipoprotein-sorting protein [Fibrobacteria bacterium]
MKMILFTVILAISISFAGEKLSAKEIIDKADDVSKISGVESISVMTIVDGKGRERVRKVAQVTKLYDKGNTEKKMIRFLSPADVKGTGLLTYDYKEKDDDMWLFMPALRKTRRIVSSEKAKSFMGSEFSYADMNPPVLDEFTYKILSEEKCGEADCWKIEIVPKDDDIAEENGFSKRITSIDKSNYVVKQTIYYDLDGELHKELTVNAVKELDAEKGKFRPTDLVMINKQNGRKSLLVIEKMVLNPKVKDEYFTTRYLERP